TCTPQSKNQVAIKLGADASLVRRWYREKGYPNGVHAIEIAKILRLDIGSVLSYIAEDKAKTEHSKSHVAKHLPRLLPTLGLAFALAVGSLTFGYKDANASEVKSMNVFDDLYIMRSGNDVYARCAAQ
ncbi:MAG: hypothetical protein ABUS47_12075, partial [Steroidobacter sp.]